MRRNPKLTPLRWLFAIIGVLVMLFAGGCGLFWLAVFLTEQQSDAANLSAGIGLFTVLPLFAGWLIWYSAVKPRR